jgi:hypothetical protein
LKQNNLLNKKIEEILAVALSINISNQQILDLEKEFETKPDPEISGYCLC